METADRAGYKSIAIPAMGTGKIGYPHDKVAAYMYDLVEKFANNHKQSKVSEVIFVVHYKDPKSKQVISLTEQSLYSESSIFGCVASISCVAQVTFWPCWHYIVCKPSHNFSWIFSTKVRQ